MATFVAALVVLVWGLLAEGSGFRPTAPAAMLAGLAVTAVAVVSPVRWIAATLVATSLVGAAALLAIPAGERCEPPVAEFAPHLFEDAAGPHEHDRCQLESDRRSIAALALTVGGGAAVPLLIKRPRTVRQSTGSAEHHS